MITNGQESIQPSIDFVLRIPLATIGKAFLHDYRNRPVDLRCRDQLWHRTDRRIACSLRGKLERRKVGAEPHERRVEPIRVN